MSSPIEITLSPLVNNFVKKLSSFNAELAKLLPASTRVGNAPVIAGATTGVELEFKAAVVTFPGLTIPPEIITLKASGNGCFFFIFAL